MQKILDSGEFILITALLFGAFFPIISKLGFNTIPPIYSAAYASLIAGIVFFSTLIARKELKTFQTCRAWKDILLSTLMIGVCLYGFLFYGISKTTAGNASVLALFEVFFSYIILSIIIKSEPLIKHHIIGAVLMVIGAGIILAPNITGSFSAGDFIIILAYVFAPLGNRYAKNALHEVSPVFLMTIRSFVSGIFLLALANLIETHPERHQFFEGAIYLLINGILILGFSKILWLEALKRLPITKASSISVIVPAFTLFFAWIILDEVPTLWQITGLIPIAIGVSLIMKKTTPMTHLNKNSAHPL